MRSGACVLMLLGFAGWMSPPADASDATITVFPNHLELRQSLHPDEGNHRGMFAASVAFHSGPGVEVLDGEATYSAVDGAGLSLVDPRAQGPGKSATTATTLVSARGGFHDPATQAQFRSDPKAVMWFAPRLAGVVISQLHVDAKLLLGDGSRTVITIGTWPQVIGPHPDDLPGAPDIAADADGGLRMMVDADVFPRYCNLWVEVAGVPVKNADGGWGGLNGRMLMYFSHRIPDGAVIKAALTRVIGERSIAATIGPWGFPGHGPSPAGVVVTVAVPDAK